MDEVAVALQRHKEIIPVLHRECNIPFRLARIQYVDFRKTGDYASALQELIRTLAIEQAA